MYTMVTRMDQENLFISMSDNLHTWEKAEMLHFPVEP